MRATDRQRAASGDERPFSMWRASVLGWAAYDFANTIFSFAVLTFYFNEWIVDDRGVADWKLNGMNALVSVVLVATLPALGAIADARGRRMPMLMGFTLACAAATYCIGEVHTTASALLVAALAIFLYQCALAQYDPLLADVAPEQYRGRVSGLGVGMGYVGVLVGATVLQHIVGDGDKQQAFAPTAAMLVVFALPTFLFVRDRAPARGAPARRVARRALGQLRVTARRIRRDHPEVLRFLLARFLYADAMLTVIAMMTVYMDRLGSFDSATKLRVQGLTMICAALGGFVVGRLVERVGPRRVLLAVLGGAACTLVVGAAWGAPASVWLLGPMVGCSLGGVWTSDRVFMLRLSPPAARGEFFAFYNLVGRVSAGIGPLVLWGGTIWLLHERRGWDVLDASRVALVGLTAATVVGALLLWRISDHVRDWETDPLEAELESLPA